MTVDKERLSPQIPTGSLARAEARRRPRSPLWVSGTQLLDVWLLHPRVCISRILGVGFRTQATLEESVGTPTSTLTTRRSSVRFCAFEVQGDWLPGLC